MARSPAANTQARTQQRDKILAAARHVFARKGRAATMADIAAQAGVSQGLAYRYFAGKEQILAEVAAHANESVPFEQFLVMPGSPMERLVALVEHVLDPAGDLAFHGLAKGLANDGKGPEGLEEWVRRRRRTLHAVVRQLIIEGQRMGEIVPGNPEHLTILLRATLDGLQALALAEFEIGSGRLPSPDMIVRGLRAETRQPRVDPAVPMPPSRTQGSGDRV